VRAAEALAASIARNGGAPGEQSGGAVAAWRPGGAGRAGGTSGDAAATLRHGSSDVAASPGAGESAGASGGDAAGQWPRGGGGEAARRVGPVAAVLEKRIPLGAGLGGGSSDAARTLAGLNRLWQVDWPAGRLAEVAAQLGSDVPFFLHGPSSVCTGRGEVVRPVPPPSRARWAVLVLPDVHMPTPAVYRRFDELGLGFDEEIAREPDWDEWSALSAKDLLARLVNDLEAPAFALRPDLAELRRGLEVQLGRVVRMSGSGSSLFTLFDEAEADQARAAAAGISSRPGIRALAAAVAPALPDDLNGAAGRA
jgi:4-diphosphocytidyl-2-C-methyl-D-erythritol kinase